MIAPRVGAAGEGSYFIDTNLLVYLYDEDEPRKRQIATETLAELNSTKIAISTQVLQEFYWVTTRKLARPLSHGPALDALARLRELEVHTVTPSTIVAAASAADAYKLSFWDALILEAALVGGCDTVLSEDLQDGFVYKQRVQVTNIFV